MKLVEAFAKRGPKPKYSEAAVRQDIATHLFHQRIEYMKEQWAGRDEGIGDLAPTTRRYNTFEEFMKGAGSMASYSERDRLNGFLMKMYPVLNKMWDEYLEEL